jgi:hypothetical protein
MAKTSVAGLVTAEPHVASSEVRWSYVFSFEAKELRGQDEIRADARIPMMW